MRLYEDKVLFKQAVASTSHHFKVEPSIVEKDYFLSLFLHELSKLLPNLLFKGGTSLSKCYNIIHRFSEDLDITLSQDTITQGQKKHVKKSIKEVCTGLGFTLLNEPNTHSRRDFNRYEISYSSEKTSIAIKPLLLVETTFVIKSYPAETKFVSSMIRDYMVSIGQQNFIQQYDLQPFPVSVQTLDRTLIDKIFALCDYYLSDKISEHSRHIYDISKLVDHVALNSEFASLFFKVRADRKSGNSQCISANDTYNISALLNEILDKKVYKDDYHKTTEQILFEDISYEEATLGIQTLIDSGLFDK